MQRTFTKSHLNIPAIEQAEPSVLMLLFADFQHAKHPLRVWDFRRNSHIDVVCFSTLSKDPIVAHAQKMIGSHAWIKDFDLVSGFNSCLAVETYTLGYTLRTLA